MDALTSSSSSITPYYNCHYSAANGKGKSDPPPNSDRFSRDKKMIGNITKGSDVGGLLKYLLHPKKNALIIGGNVGAETPKGLYKNKFMLFEEVVNES